MLTDEQIYRYLLGDPIIREMYCSPIPDRNDDTPSFNIYPCLIKGENRLLWKDWGLPDQTGFLPIDLVMYMKECNIQQARNLLKDLERMPPTSLKKNKPLRIRHHDSIPLLKFRSINDGFEKNYWKNFGQDIAILEKENIFAVESLQWITSKGNSPIETSVPEDPAFVYIFNKNPFSWKRYRPLAKDKKFKWLSWSIGDHIEGEFTCNKDNDLLLVWSSTKDRLVGKLFNYNIINPTGEAAWKIISRRKDEFKNKRKVIMFDDDDNMAGSKSARKLAEETGWEYIDMYGKLGFDNEGKRIKDFARYFEFFGENELRNLLNKML